MKRHRLSRNRFTVIGIDQGSSSTKSVVLREEGTILGRAVWPIKTEGDRIVSFEHNPDEILSSVRAAVEWGRAISVEVGSSVAGVGLATQRSGVMAWSRDGAPLSPVLSWRDARGSELASQVLSSSEIVAAIEARSGLIPNPFFAASKLSLLQQRYSATEANVTTLDSFLINGLVGCSAPVTDDSMASRTLLFDISEHRWSPALCGFWGVDIKRLPQIRPSVMVPGTFPSMVPGTFGGPKKVPGTMVGKKVPGTMVERESKKVPGTKLGQKVPGTILGVVPLLASLGDKEAAVVGAVGFGCLEGPQRVVIDIGTLITMTIASNSPPSPVRGVGRGVLCSLGSLSGGDGKRRFVYQQELRSSISGDILDWLRARYGDGYSLERMSDIASSAVNHDGVLFARPRTGSFADSSSRGSSIIPFEPIFDGISDEEPMNVSAALEHVVFSVAELIERGRALNIITESCELIVSGGLAMLPNFCQNLSNLSAIPLLIEKDGASGSAVGAAWLAREAAFGWFGDSSVSKGEPRVVDRQRISPMITVSDTALFKRYQRWQSLRDRVLGENGQ